MFGKKTKNQESSDDEDYSSSDDDDHDEEDNRKGNFADENSDDDDDDDDNPNEFQSINVYPPGQYGDEEGGAANRSNNYDGSEQQTSKRRIMIAGLAVCCCCWLIASIVFGVLAFTKKDDTPQQAAVVTPPVSPSTPTNPPSPSVAPVAAPITEPPSFSPSAQPSGFLQSEFVYPALASTYIQKGLMDPQINSPTLLVENGNGDTDAYALFALDVSSKGDNIFRGRRELNGQFTGKATRSFLRIFLAADPGTPPPKLTLFKLPGDEELKFLTAQEFNQVLAEELQSFRFSDLPHPAVTGIANLDKNVFLPPPREGDPIWIDITQVVDSAAAFGDETIVLMLQNRDAVQAPGSGTLFYGVNSDNKPALVVFLDDTVPTVSPFPSMSVAPSANPSGSIYPTNISSNEPSPGPSISDRPTNKPSKVVSYNPTASPSSSARPSASERPSTNPSVSSAPSKSAQPSKVASAAPSKAPLASEFPTNFECLPCPQGQVLKWSTATVTSMSETCSDLRYRLLYSDYAVIDATTAQCTDIVNTCGGCEAPVACGTCDVADERFQSSDTTVVNGVTCQEAQVNLLIQPNAYGEAQCTALRNACTCAVPTNVCNICPANQAVGDPDYVLSTSTMGLISCLDLEILGSVGYMSSDDCSKLQTVGVDSLCKCDLKSGQPSMQPSLSPSKMGSMSPSKQPSSMPSKQPSLSYMPSTSFSPSKQPSTSNSPSISSGPSKLPSTSAKPSTTPQ